MSAPLRPELRFLQPSERAAADALATAAFGGPAEAALLSALRDGPDLIAEIAAVDGGAVIGVAAFSAASIDGPGARVPVAVVAPVAVSAAHRGRGVGAALTRAGLVQCRRKGCAAALALGHPAFFTRLGFSTAAAAAIDGPWSGPAFQALALNDEATLEGRATVAAAFAPLMGPAARAEKKGDAT